MKLVELTLALWGFFAPPQVTVDADGWEDAYPQAEQQEQSYSVFVTDKDTKPYTAAYSGSQTMQVLAADWNGINRGFDLVEVYTKKRRKLTKVAVFHPDKDCVEKPDPHADFRCYKRGDTTISLEFTVGTDSLPANNAYYVRIHDKGKHISRHRLYFRGKVETVSEQP